MNNPLKIAIGCCAVFLAGTIQISRAIDRHAEWTAELVISSERATISQICLANAIVFGALPDACAAVLAGEEPSRDDR